MFSSNSLTDLSRNAFAVPLLYCFLIVSFALCILLSYSGFQTSGSGPPGVVLGITYWLDPLLLSFVSFLLTTLVVAWRFPHLSSDTWGFSRVFHFVMIGAILAVFLIVSYCFEVLLLKPGFSIDRPLRSAGESFFLWSIGYSPDPVKSATPSGFALRQAVMSFLCLLCSVREKKPEGWIIRRRSMVLSLCVVLLSVLLAFIRVYRGLHTPLDIGIGFACGYFFLLVWYYIAVSYVAGRQQNLVRIVVASLLIYGPVFFFYSASAIQATQLILLTIVLVAVPEILPRPARRMRSFR